MTDMREITLTQGKVALVDDEDFEMLSAFKWYAQRSNLTFYAQRAISVGGGRQTAEIMHRVLMPGIEKVDHIDGDGLNNQRANLRDSEGKNAWNRKPQEGGTSVYKGVSWHSRIGKWQAQIMKDGRTHYLGYFDSEIDAARAYNEGSLKFHGRFGRLNEIPGE